MNNGKLYLVPTPIGNLKDITLRALEVLKEADVIAAEDTRQTLKLLNHFDIKKTLISYHMHNEQGKSEEIINRLKNGEKIALVSDAGMPGISDPGSIIIKKCVEDGIEFEVLPGATAFATALIYSALDSSAFAFRGFISRENKERNKLIEEIKEMKETLIFYEAPHRLISTLTFLQENLGNREMAACRELTKLHEEIKRGRISEVKEYFLENQPRGEFVLVVSGKTEEEFEKEKMEEWEHLTIEDHIRKYINDGFSKKDAIKMVAKDRKEPKSVIYKYSTEI
ncbi:16S rRNA (cytidine(1402)-2'-O)-methyltransferase [Clostridium thermobutyricum]|uniref:Ribosomal RNA small subunit methyltransferase I n=1 Tax=Clostridium thermobutyricum DSM 4928 TaxID=1121339 RepID=A0A1V4SXI6_9CLOT|nr:16S rRNA (cytidine(1402)-2'-O)-methyltransferase [Clostridium thermobutyricum]OPX49363.1 ribosomal RNA small subunit methyltransferase I [Clostridium thermobutyricum DSM 4928]